MSHMYAVAAHIYGSNQIIAIFDSEPAAAAGLQLAQERQRQVIDGLLDPDDLGLFKSYYSGNGEPECHVPLRVVQIPEGEFGWAEYDDD